MQYETQDGTLSRVSIEHSNEALTQVVSSGIKQSPPIGYELGDQTKP